MAVEPRGINQRVELSKWHFIFLVAYHFQFTTVYSNLACATQRSNSSCISIHFSAVFLFLFIPAEGLCCRPKYWANILHSFDYQNSLTSKCVENWALFERPNLCTASDRHYRNAPGPPRGVPNAKPSKASSFFVQFKDAYISTFQRPDSH